MIELLIGPYRTGKTGRLLKKLVQYKQEHPLDGALILVPSHRYGRLLRAQLLDVLKEHTKPGKTPGVFGVQICTVYETCENVLKQAGELTRVLPRDICVTVVAEAMRRLSERGELNQLAPIARFAGAAPAIFRLVDELERAAVSPTHVVSTLKGTAGETSKHLELANIYREYWNVLDEMKCTDQKRQAFSAREVLSRKQLPAFGFRMLAVDGFDRISPLQAEVMLALSKHAQDTHLAFDYLRPEDRAASEEEDDEYSWKDASYGELARRFNVEPYTVPACLRESELTTQAFKTLDAFLESQEIARRCKQAIELRKAKPTEILVVSRDIKHYSGAMRAAFAEAALPFFIDETIEYNSLPYLKYLRQVFTLALNDFPRRQVIDCLRSPFCNSEKFKLRAFQIEKLDKATIKAGLVGQRPRWDEYIKNIKDEDFGTMLDAFLIFLTPPKTAKVSQYAAWLEDREQLVREKPNHSPLTEQEQQSLQGFRSALRTLIVQTEIFGDAEVTYAEFFAKFEQALEGTTFNTADVAENAVYICSAEHAPNRRYDEVYVAGTLEGQFPRHSGESGFVSADERGKWKSYGIDLTNPREERGFEKALFKSLEQQARKIICYSHPECDLGGDEVVPSFYFNDGTITVQAERIDSNMASLSSPYSARDAVSGWLWHTPGIELPLEWEEEDKLRALWQRVSLPLIGAYQRHESNSATAYNGYLVDLTSAQILDINLPATWSATSLGTYGECPFKFWIRYSLGLKPREEPELGLTVFVKGRLYHKILELFYKNQNAAGGREALDAEQRENVLKQSFAQALAEMANDPEFHPGPYWENEQNDILFRVRRFVEFDNQRLDRDKIEWQPALFEVDFGKNTSELPPLIVPTEFGDAVITGSVDRVDLADVGEAKPLAAVIDYKTGSSPVTEEDARAGAKIQLPLYAMAVELVVKPDAKVSVGNYLSVNTGKSNGKVNFEKSADLVEHTQEFIRNTVAGVKRGDFSVKPYKAKACANCDYTTVCRITDLKRFSSEEDA